MDGTATSSNSTNRADGARMILASSTFVRPYNFVNVIHIARTNGTNLALGGSRFNPPVVGFGGKVVFPVLPDSMLQISIGNSIGEATKTVTIT